MKICTVEGCDRKHAAKGYCMMHYLRVWRTGTTAPPLSPTMEERFWAKVQKSDTCWLWMGAITGTGYGNFWDGQRYRRAHQVSLELAGQTIDKSLEIDHLCRVRNCVRPDHLEQVTAQVNQLRGYAAGAIVNRTGKCLRGHVLDAANTYVRKDGKGRQCLTCARERQLRYAAKRQAQVEGLPLSLSVGAK